MKLAILGGGAWGATLGQLLIDNGHEVIIYDINTTFVDLINNHHIHPFFDLPLSNQLKATNDLSVGLAYSDYIVLAVPTKVMRGLLTTINSLLEQPKYFINVSKGIEPDTAKRVSEIVNEVIETRFLKGFAVLTGPSHAEEVIRRKLTLLTVASTDESLAIELQNVFSNDTYMRVYRSTDLIGCEVGGAVKNAIAVVSGIATGLDMGENARAALITRGILEMVRVIESYGGTKESAFGLTGIGDLIVTATSEHSRNFKAGKEIGKGKSLEQIYQEQKQTIEGVRSILALHQLAEQKGLSLPIIEVAYHVIYENMSVDSAVTQLLTRTLKSEKIE
ncbi:MAG: NAD(P)H-dependent glycerol-3-phosphate dehydrogenase [Acholeplasma sp.]|nr:NAD(P)H-dependent glycerol-3-phosphate dehydrogenase [Acholeplasma sp.]